MRSEIVLVLQKLVEELVTPNQDPRPVPEVKTAPVPVFGAVSALLYPQPMAQEQVG